MIRFAEVLGVVSEERLLEAVKQTIQKPDDAQNNEYSKSAYCVKHFPFGTIRVDLRCTSAKTAEVVDAYFLTFNYLYPHEQISSN